MGMRSGKAWAVVLLVVVLLSANAWFWFGRDRTESRTRADVSTTSAEATSSTMPRSVDAEELTARTYVSGDCVTWNPSKGTADTDVVDCAQPHLIEMAGSVDLRDDPTVGRSFPEEAAWDAIVDRHCVPLVNAHFGRPVDPNGRFTVNSIIPTKESWNDGDRTIWCGVTANDQDGVGTADSWVTFAGPVDLSAQAIERPVGQCRTILPSGSTAAVDCSQPHQLEFVGVATLPDAAAYPGDDVVHAVCLPLAEAYAGRDATFNYGYWDFDDRSWNAGVRRINCVIGSPGDQQGWGTRTSSLRR